MSTSFQLEGGFEIRCAARPDGTTFIDHQAVSAPFHLSKPYWDGRVLTVQCVNATAGVFAGDRLKIGVSVEPGASVLLTSPSASRIHAMKSGMATLEQSFKVASGAWLEVMPELFIPQAGCRYAQRSVIDVEKGGRLFFVETLAPGRVARGEVFAFDHVSWETDLRVGGKLAVRERYALTPSDDSLWQLRARGGETYLATCYGVGLDLDPASALASTGEGDLAGASRLTPDVWVARILAPDSVSLKASLRTFREALAASVPELSANARKL